jgi:anti-sigma B factor antagonist
MELTITKLPDGNTILKLEGRMDIGGTEEIDLKLSSAATEENAFMIADLSGVGFMSTIGIGTLVRIAKAIRRRGGNLVLLAPQPVVRLVLEKTRIDELISIHDNLEQAALAVRATPKFG